MTRDRVYAEELAHDSGVKLTKHDLEEALDDLIERLFEGGKVGQMYLADYVEKYAEEIAVTFINHEIHGAEYKLQALIRRELEDSDAVRERAVELAQEGE
jgi:hypothetical protein